MPKNYNIKLTLDILTTGSVFFCEILLEQNLFLKAESDKLPLTILGSASMSELIWHEIHHVRKICTIRNNIFDFKTAPRRSE